MFIYTIKKRFNNSLSNRFILYIFSPCPRFRIEKCVPIIIIIIIHYQHDFAQELNTYSFTIGRTRFVQSKQTGKGRHPGDDCQVPEAEGDSATVAGGSVSGGVQAMHRTGSRPFGRTVDGRPATPIWSTDDRTLGGMRTTVERASFGSEPFVVFLFRRIQHDDERRSTSLARYDEEFMFLVI